MSKFPNFRIAIIDSGINIRHPHINGNFNIEGLAFVKNQSNRIEISYDINDYIGHGTAIAALFRNKVPHAKLVILKIFHTKLNTSFKLLKYALSWAIKNSINLVLCSLGTIQMKYKKNLQVICDQAIKQNILIVAAGRNPNDNILPAALPKVVGVFGDKSCKEDEISYYPNCKISFGAYGYPLPLDGLPQQKNFYGSSFAAARVACCIAKIWISNPKLSINEIIDYVKRIAKNKKLS